MKNTREIFSDLITSIVNDLAKENEIERRLPEPDYLTIEQNQLLAKLIRSQDEDQLYRQVVDLIYQSD